MRSEEGGGNLLMAVRSRFLLASLFGKTIKKAGE
jgi:hypothetical protein